MPVHILHTEDSNMMCGLRRADWRIGDHYVEHLNVDLEVVTCALCRTRYLESINALESISDGGVTMTFGVSPELRQMFEQLETTIQGHTEDLRTEIEALRQENELLRDYISTLSLTCCQLMSKNLPQGVITAEWRRVMTQALQDSVRVTPRFHPGPDGTWHFDIDPESPIEESNPEPKTAWERLDEGEDG